MTFVPAKHEFSFTYRYPYRNLPDGKSVPMLEVRFENGPNSLTSFAVIDSGAEFTLLPQSCGLALGLSKQSLGASITLSTLGGPLRAYRHVIERLIVLDGEGSEYVIPNFELCVADREITRNIFGRDFFQ